MKQNLMIESYHIEILRDTVGVCLRMSVFWLSIAKKLHDFKGAVDNSVAGMNP